MGDFTMHMCVSVKGVLRWPKRDLRKMFRRDDGTPLTPDEARDYLLDELAKGHEVLPMTNTPCEGFDYVKGCPGHPHRQDDALSAREGT